ncbi:MAG: L-seryl-tRNA(Sec) selenium transferase [Nitriliruptorales bacterium]
MADLSRIPQVDAVLRHSDAEPVIETYGRRSFTDAVRLAIDEARERAREGGPVSEIDDLITDAAGRLADRRSGRLERVVNATGVVLHTNLGRAPLSAEARAAMADAAGYCSLELELADGERGSRTAHVGRLAADACGAEAATVVNNGAAALVLVLAALSAGREAIVSRGELVEIGGSFRLPDVMSASGAVLREVGTTNRTKIEDYRRALGDQTGVVLKVHRSNYRIVGFASEPPAGEVAALVRERGISFVYDLGSGLLRDTERSAEPGPVADEPSAERALAAGADLVVFSGDKLLGGPQAGIIAGRSDLVERCARHPLARAFRIDKFRRAALEVTLESHLRSDMPIELPVWAMLTTEPAILEARAKSLADSVGGPTTAAAVTSVTGGGSMPGAELPSWAVVVDVDRPDALARALRTGDPPIVGRVDAGSVVLDLRTVPPAQDELVAHAVRRALGRLTR